MKHVRKLKTALLVLSVLSVSACLEKKEDAIAAITSGSTAATLFTASDISGGSSKQWISACTAYTDPILGTAYYKQYLTLQSNGAYSLQHYAYTAPSGQSQATCANYDYKTVFMATGAYSVGSALTTGVQALAFAVSTSTLMVTDSNTTSHTATQNIFNSDCGGTSPYCTLSGQSCVNNGINAGVGQNSANMSCSNYTFVSNGTTVYNIGSYSNGVLTLGAGAIGLPGVTNSSSLSGSTPAITFQ
ncbi:hypothetical protein CIK05_04515 [Bdellovibrio sp. qaytius]|nr:hypothetical protein CIK05_04515 [Bdellovibrio sp. qaytius]